MEKISLFTQVLLVVSGFIAAFFEIHNGSFQRGQHRHNFARASKIGFGFFVAFLGAVSWLSGNILARKQSDELTLVKSGLFETYSSLEALDDRTKSMRNLADGRTQIANIAAGVPNILGDLYSESLKNYNAKQYEDSVRHAQEFVDRYQLSEQQSKGIILSTTFDNMNAMAASMYGILAESALSNDEHEKARLLINTANGLHRTPFNDAIKFVTLIWMNEYDGWQSLLNEYQLKGQDDRDAFFHTLIKMGAIQLDYGSPESISKAKESLNLSVNLDLETPSAIRVATAANDSLPSNMYLLQWKGLGRQIPVPVSIQPRHHGEGTN